MVVVQLLRKTKFEDLGIRRRYLCALYFLIFWSTVWGSSEESSSALSSDTDNAIIGSPIVECERDLIRFKVPTKKPFRGKIYVKGEFTNDNCIRSYSVSSAGEKRFGNVDSQGEFKTVGGSTVEKKRKTNKHIGSSSSTVNVDANEIKNNNFSPSKSKKVNNGNDDEGEDTPENERSNEIDESKKTENLLSNPDFHPENVGDEKEARLTSPSVTIFDTKKRRNGGGKQTASQRTILGETANGNLPGFGATQHNTNWRSFLRGRPDAPDGVSFRRYGSRVSPDSNGECPLQCPPCEECHQRQLADDPIQNDRKSFSTPKGNGKGYVYNNEEYKLLHKRAPPSSQHSAELEVMLGSCNTRRDRIANPPGIHVSFTVVVSFHNSFITKVDRAYHIECAYEESDQTVTTQIDVSQPPIVELNGVVDSPQCEYRIRDANGHNTLQNDDSKGSLTSSTVSVTNVRVGDNVRHEWFCHKANSDLNNNQNVVNDDNEHLHHLFGLLVHDCYVDDGRGRKELVIDSQGCSVSPLILPTPTYPKDRLGANVESLVAKFPDRDLLGFQCAITICVREMGQCNGITPPNCDSAINTNRTRRFAGSQNKDMFLSNWQLHAPVLTVFDADEKHASEFEKILASTAAQTSYTALSGKDDFDTSDDFSGKLDVENVCVSVPAFGILVAVFTFLVTVSAAVIFVFIFLNSKLLAVSNESLFLHQRKY